MSNAIPAINIVPTLAQVKAANAICRNMKKNKKDNAKQLIEAALNNYLLHAFEKIQSEAEKVWSNKYDEAVADGATFKLDRAAYIAEHVREGADVLAVLQGKLKELPVAEQPSTEKK